MQDLTGKVIKSYEIKELLGMGGFGAVYRARQDVVDREVAIKVIWPAFANHPDFIRRFETEAQVVAGLEHPHIVPLYDYWREPDGAYIVMRWLRGGHLKDMIRKSAVPMDDISRILGQITAGLTLAHRYGIVHRDMKPENILLDDDENAYLADFGIAQILRDVQDADEDLFGSMGSPAYAAPEQIRGDSTSPACDLYSVGVMLYEMIVGEHPFPELAEMTHTELLRMRAEATLPSLMITRPDLPPTLDEVIQKATAINPADRYADAVSMARAFREAMGMGAGRGNGASVRTTADHDVIPNPYKGLRAFQEADATRFFGREGLIRRLVYRLQEDEIYSRFLAVVGPSGSGKSSVVHAGLIPALKHGAIRGSKNWYYVDMVPGSEPFQELESALIGVAADDIDNLMETLLNDERGLFRAIEKILPDKDSELLLFIDQFEEVFTLVDDPDITEQFLECIFTAVTDEKSRLRLILTLRADFYDRPLLQPISSTLMQDRTEVVVPLTTQELERSIVEPARRVGVYLDSGLVAAIITEVNEQPGALPLLQYSLSELFERREGNLITPNGYRQIGGVRGALAKRADEIYTGFDPRQQEAARQLFLRLITLGEGTEDTRRRALLSEVTSVSQNEEVMRGVIDALGKSRLLTFDRDPATRSPTVEVTHEAIIREWGRLRSWLDESRNDVRFQRTLAQLTNDWIEAGRDPSFLLRGVRLEQYESWVETTNVALTEEESTYLKASTSERQRLETQELQRVQWEEELERRALTRLRLLVGVLLVAFVVTLGLLGFAFVQSQQAQQNALISQSLALEASSRRALDENDGDLAVALAMEANEIDNPSLQAQRTLAEVATARGTRRVFIGHTAWVTSVDISPDNQQVISGSTDFTVRLWDSVTGDVIHELDGHHGDVQGVRFSPDGTKAVSSAADFLAIIWDLETGTIIHELTGHTRTVWDAEFNPDGTRIVTGSTDTSVRLWDVQSGAEIRQYEGNRASVLTVAFSPDGTQIVSGARDGTLLVWDTETGEQIVNIAGHDTAVTDIAFSPDGTQLVSSDGNGLAILWDLETGTAVKTFDVSDEDATEIRGVSFFPDGKRILLGVFDGSLQIWDIESGEQISHLDGHTDAILGISVSNDGLLAVSGSKDFTLRLWNIGTPSEVTETWLHTERVTGIRFPLDVNTALSASSDGSMSIWNLQTGEQVQSLGIPDDRILTLDVNRNTGLIYTGGQDQRVNIWSIESGELVDQIEGMSEVIRSIELSADGSQMLVGGQSGLIELWDLSNNTRISEFIGHEGPVFDLEFHPDGKRFYSAGNSSNEILEWDITSGTITRRFAGHTDLSYSLTLNRDGTLLVSSSGDTNAIVWNIETGEEQLRLTSHTDAIWSTDFSPDGTLVITGSSDGNAIIWDIETGSEFQRFNSLERAAVFSTAFSPSGDFVITGEEDGSLQVWNVFSLNTLRQWVEENRYVRPLTCAEAERFRVEEENCTNPEDETVQS